jgi:hypothetical protein
MLYSVDTTNLHCYIQQSEYPIHTMAKAQIMQTKKKPTQPRSLFSGDLLIL